MLSDCDCNRAAVYRFVSHRSLATHRVYLTPHATYACGRWAYRSICACMCQIAAKCAAPTRVSDCLLYICHHVDFGHVTRDVKMLAEYAHRMGTNQDGLVGFLRAIFVVLFVASGGCCLLHILDDFDPKRRISCRAVPRRPWECVPDFPQDVRPLCPAFDTGTHMHWSSHRITAYEFTVSHCLTSSQPTRPQHVLMAVLVDLTT